MRDNIKPVEAGFFKYCMKNLSHEYCNLNARIRDGKQMWDLMNDYSIANNIPFKVIYNIVDKWDAKGIFKWGIFHPIKFPIEYIMLIPRRVLRKVHAFGMMVDSDRNTDYSSVFIFKTMANGLEDTTGIRESRIDYWTDPAFTVEKYNTALRIINKMIDGAMEYYGGLLIRCIKYIMNAHATHRRNIMDDVNLANHTARTLKKYVEFARTDKQASHDACGATYRDFISDVNIFVDDIFKDIDCK